MVDTKGFIVDTTPTTRKIIFFRRLKIIFLGGAMVRLYRRQLSHPPAKILWTKKKTTATPHPCSYLPPADLGLGFWEGGGVVGGTTTPPALSLPPTGSGREGNRRRGPPPASLRSDLGVEGTGAGPGVAVTTPCRGRPRASPPPPSPSLSLAGSRRGGEGSRRRLRSVAGERRRDEGRGKGRNTGEER